ncbi:hypothetical protein RRSWK_03400 [Rhodopirellula sp. SWK7]|nr:hypothetical protein RRSWK_03400 [Rhodopirellula sp. SWK7]
MRAEITIRSSSGKFLPNSAGQHTAIDPSDRLLLDRLFVAEGARLPRAPVGLRSY